MLHGISKLNMKSTVSVFWAFLITMDLAQPKSIHASDRWNATDHNRFEKNTGIVANTFVFLDAETTGLHNPNMTELAMWATKRQNFGDIGSEGVPRLIGKWSMFFDPAMTITSEASRITGLYNDMLEDFNMFDENAGKAILSYLDHYPKPICLIAHNGIRFDFPIIKRSLERVGLTIPDYILCADSLNVIKELEQFENQCLEEPVLSVQSVIEKEESLQSIPPEIKDESKTNLGTLNSSNELLHSKQDLMKERQRINETTPRRNHSEKFTRHSQNTTSNARKELFPPVQSCNRNVAKATKKSFRLGAIYERIFKCQPIVSHTAEADVETLHRIAMKYGKDFIEIADKHAFPFSKIGT